MSLLACVVGEPALKHYSNMCRDPECVIVQLLPRPGGWRRRPNGPKRGWRSESRSRLGYCNSASLTSTVTLLSRCAFFVNNCLFKMNWKEKLKSLQGVQARIVSSVVGGKVRTNVFLIFCILRNSLHVRGTVKTIKRHFLITF